MSKTYTYYRVFVEPILNLDGGKEQWRSYEQFSSEEDAREWIEEVQVSQYKIIKYRLAEIETKT